MSDELAQSLGGVTAGDWLADAEEALAIGKHLGARSSPAPSAARKITQTGFPAAGQC